MGWLLLCLCAVASAQTPTSQTPDAPTPATQAASAHVTVAVSVTASGLRFTALGPVKQTRLELFDASGNTVFDSGFQPGTVRDWSPHAAGQTPPADGSYQCVATARDLSGRLSLKRGAVEVSGGQLALRLGEAEPAGGVEGGGQDALAPVGDETPALTVAAHDGRDGQLTSTVGGLTLRTGDLLAGKDREQVRVTEDGRVGIGTNKPEATLDVAGDIRSSGDIRSAGEVRAAKGLRFDDGTVLSSATGVAQKLGPDGEPLPLAAGSGTTNRVAKWLETGGAGTLGNSAITEVRGFVGIGTTNPGGQLHIGGTATQDLFAGMGPDVVAGPAFNFGYAGGSFGRGAGFFNARPDASATAPNPSLRFMTANVERMIVTNTGNVGVGTTAPTTRLHVVGNTTMTGDLTVTGALTATLPAGSENYIQNNPASQQSGSFSISGDGIVDGTLLSGGLRVDFNTLLVEPATSRVGIGTSTPSAKLHVEGFSDDDFSPLAVLNSLTGQVPLALKTNGTERARIRSDAFGNLVFATLAGASKNIFFRANGDNDPSTDMIVSGATGNVGVGTDTPAHRLDVAGHVNTSTQYNLRGQRLLGVTGPSSTPDRNLFVGFGAGQSNTAGRPDPSSGTNNTFVGTDAGRSNTTGSNGSFFGLSAGFANTSGSLNAFFGTGAGFTNTTGGRNSFFGTDAGINNSAGNFNSFFGLQAGRSNTSGSSNSFFGMGAGFANTTGVGNTVVGSSADVGSGGLTNATAIGSLARVDISNSLVLGSVNGVNGATSNTNVGIGTTAPTARLHVDGNIKVATLGTAGTEPLCRNELNEISACFPANAPESAAASLAETVRRQQEQITQLEARLAQLERLLAAEKAEKGKP